MNAKPAAKKTSTKEKKIVLIPLDPCFVCGCTTGFEAAGRIWCTRSGCLTLRGTVTGR